MSNMRSRGTWVIAYMRTAYEDAVFGLPGTLSWRRRREVAPSAAMRWRAETLARRPLRRSSTPTTLPSLRIGSVTVPCRTRAPAFFAELTRASSNARRGRQQLCRRSGDPCHAPRLVCRDRQSTTRRVASMWCAPARTLSSPSCRRNDTADDVSPSPHAFSRGNECLSMSTTSWPLDASVNAATAPLGPPPTTAISASSRTGSSVSCPRVV